jgi:predicted membrane-bound spermidine synthase
MIFPLALKMLLSGKSKISGYVGLGYTVNTLGAMLGALVTGLVLIPILGAQKSIYLVSFVNIAIFCLLFIYNPLLKTGKLIVILTVITVFFIIQMFIPGDYFEKTLASKIKEEIVFFKEGIDGTVIVSKTEDDIYLLWINGLITAFPCEYMRYRAHIPVLLSADPKDALVVGFGSGVTLGVMAEFYGIKTDCVEISKSVIEAGGFFSKYNHNALNSNNVNIFIMDARNFVEFTKKKYDIIIVDSSQPALAYASSLFSKEFYKICHNILKEDGIMLQWMPSTKDTIDSKILVKTFINVFDNSYFFHGDNMIGTKKPLRVDLKAIDSKISQNEIIMRELHSLNINNGKDLLNFLIADKDSLAKFAEDVPVITDDRPFIEFSVFRNGAANDHDSTIIYSPKDIIKMKSGLN